MEYTKKHQNVAIVCGGEIKDTAWLKTELFNSDFIIAADSGYDKCVLCGITPQLIVGDFDSVTASVPAELPRLTFPVRKDKTDFSLCLDYCVQQGFKSVSVYGAWGGRMDHSLGAVFSILQAAEQGLYPKLKAENCTAFIVTDNCNIAKNDGYISIFALGEDAKGVTLNGFDYPLNNFTLSCCSPLGVSNKINDDIGTISLKKGCLLVVIQDKN